MEHLNVIITSDPQYPWTEKTDNGTSESDSAKESRSAEYIAEQYRDINNYVASSTRPSIVLINGDLTAFGHGWQRKKMTELMNILTPPIRWGLGNHDIENNYHDTANNGAATDTMRDFLAHYQSLSLSNKSWDVSITQGSNNVDYTGSFNYSWDEGDYHFIQMNNYPGMTGYNYNKTIITTDKRKVYMRWDENLIWLKNTITKAIARGKQVIINIHKPDTWPNSALNAMKALFSAYKDNIKAIFCGHYHKVRGYNASYTEYMGGDIPVFLSGSASQKTYLIMENDWHGLYIYLVTNNNWRQRELIYGPMVSVSDKTIIPEINKNKAATIGANSSLTLQDIYEFPEQLFSINITKHIYDWQVYSISQSGKESKLFWNKDKSPELIFNTGNETDYSRWHIDRHVPETSHVISSYANSIKTIDVPDSKTENGTELVIDNRTNNANQRFLIADSRLGEPVYIASLLNLSVVISSQTENRDVIVYSRDEGVRQIFVFIRCDNKGSNVYQIVNIWTGFVLAWNTVTSKEVFFHKNEYKDEHYWRLEIYGSNSYIISNFKDSSLVLDVSNANTANGTRIQLHARNGNDAQIFSLIKHSNPPAVPAIYDLTAIITNNLDGINDIVKVEITTSKIILSQSNQDDAFIHFYLVRARAKGPSVWQIRSSTFPGTAISLFNDGLYLLENHFDDTQFWNIHANTGNKSNERYIISSFSNPNQVWCKLNTFNPMPGQSNMGRESFLTLRQRPSSEDYTGCIFNIDKI
ncbi:RICIN domain-containing protein [Kalamiella sp. sgz302252]|uniref:RICIN domain-containing protein n=1 Tax=Pantoea sp. sgz302252 TaxID=3341827 RepID=UPI0036D42781